MVGLNVVSGMLPYANAFLLGQIVNLIVRGASGTESSLWLLVLLYAAVETLPTILGNLQLYVNRHRMLTLQMETDLELLSYRERIDIARYEDPQFLDLVQRTFRAGPNPTYQLGNSMFDVTRASVSFIVGTALSVHFSLWVYVLVIVTAIPAFLADVKYAGKAWSIWAKDSPEQRRLADLRQHLMNRTALIETKLLQSKDKILGWIRKIFTDFANVQRQLEKNRVWQTSLADVVALVGFGSGMFLVLNGVVKGETSVGTLVYILGTLSSVRGSITKLLESISAQFENALVVLDIKKFVTTEPIVKDAENPVAFNLESAPEIVFENVSFAYPNSSRLILKNLTLTLKPGDKIGLVGNNGAGKTTFVKLLCRIYDPTNGRILINGVDLRDIALKEWWSHLGIMFQDYATYDFKAKEAIAIGRPNEELDFVRVRHAADMSQASEFIETWKEKFEHQIGVEFSGIEPSKGQRQKLSIAKVVYRNAKVMILDEPTASVDAESEAKIFDSLEHLSTDVTALFISHDFSTISQCRQILVLENGELIEEGDHPTLMKQKGKYAELYNLQAKRFKE